MMPSRPPLRPSRNVAFCTYWLLSLTWLGSILLTPERGGAQSPDASATLRIGEIQDAPDLRAASDTALLAASLQGFTRVTGFVQRLPHDGTAAQHETVAYLAYDANALHVVFLAVDGDPSRVRARLVPREQLGGDDYVTVLLDTDHDARRAYAFRSNGRGVQWDALFNEGQGYDVSFDAVWTSDARTTPWGYLVHMAIPFRSLRFDPAHLQTWGIVLSRQLARDSQEDTHWPRVSASVQGTLTQSATLEGLRGISPGRNLQAIPYGTFRAFRAVDPRADGGPRFVSDPADVSVGGDFKAVVDDRFVVDLTANPDFSQVESDQPQRTVNQRFEVFFPERRPFFMENADYFRTPINLLFTRRIRDPRIGSRFTGKAGAWGIGALVIDDEAPGKIVQPGSELEGARAWFGAARLTRDVGEHSTVGGMLVGRELQRRFNRAGGVDTRVRLDDHWTVTGQAARSETSGAGQETRSGSAYSGSVSRVDRNLSVFFNYSDIAPDFDARAGFVPRTDVRRLTHFSSYFWRPEDDALTSWGPELFARAVWDHDGILLDDLLEGSLEWNFASNTGFEVNYRVATERLRPEDHPALERLRAYDVTRWDIETRTSVLDWLSASVDFGWGRQTHFSPPDGRAPETGDWREVDATVSFRPTTRLRVDNDMIWARMSHPDTGGPIFTDWIVRSRWNWQWSRELSVRAIVQFERTSADTTLTTLAPRRSLDGDLLVTYRVNPWTAVYAGLNANALNRTLVEVVGDRREFQRIDGLEPEGRQLFVKVTYLLRL